MFCESDADRRRPPKLPQNSAAGAAAPGGDARRVRRNVRRAPEAFFPERDGRVEVGGFGGRTGAMFFCADLRTVPKALSARARAAGTPPPPPPPPRARGTLSADYCVMKGGRGGAGGALFLGGGSGGGAPGVFIESRAFPQYFPPSHTVAPACIPNLSSSPLRFSLSARSDPRVGIFDQFSRARHLTDTFRKTAPP